MNQQINSLVPFHSLTKSTQHSLISHYGHPRVALCKDSSTADRMLSEKDNGTVAAQVVFQRNIPISKQMGVCQKHKKSLSETALQKDGNSDLNESTPSLPCPYCHLEAVNRLRVKNGAPRKRYSLTNKCWQDVSE